MKESVRFLVLYAALGAAAHPPFGPDGFAARESAVHSTPWDDRTRGWWNDRADFIENLVRDHGFFHGWGR